MPDEDARSLLGLIGERVRCSEIEVRNHDALMRLWAILEDDPAAAECRAGHWSGSGQHESDRDAA